MADKIMADSLPALTRSYVHVPRKIPYIGVTIGQQLYIATDKWPDREMFVCYEDKERITFQGMKEQSQQFAASLISQGLRKGDTLAIWGGNHMEWVIAVYGCAQIGVVAVHFRRQWITSTVASLLRKLRCKAILLTRSPSDIVDKACDIIPELRHSEAGNLNSESFPDLKLVVCGESRDIPSQNRFCYGLSKFLKLGSEEEKKMVSDICWTIDIDDTCFVYLTSGTTGLPKPTAVSHHSLLNNCATGGTYRTEVEGFDSKWDTARIAIAMDFATSTSYLVLFPPIVHGCTCIVLHATYDLQIMVRALQDEKITEGLFFIHQMSDLANMPNLTCYDLSNLRIVSIGGSVIPYRLRQKVKQFAKYTTGEYGMTETCSVCYGHPLDPQDKIDDDALYPVGGMEVKIVNDTGQIVPVDTIGEMHIRSYSTMKCYWENDDKTKEVNDSNGWIHTGDLAKMDRDGFLRIRDRMKDLINKEALLISPAELEAVLYKHPSVIGALAVAVPDERTGEEVCACIRIHKDDAMPTQTEIIAFCHGKVNTSLIPKYVLFVKEFPTTKTGKFSRKAMADIATGILGLAGNSSS